MKISRSRFYRVGYVISPRAYHILSEPKASLQEAFDVVVPRDEVVHYDVITAESGAMLLRATFPVYYRGVLLNPRQLTLVAEEA